MCFCGSRQRGHNRDIHTARYTHTRIYATPFQICCIVINWCCCTVLLRPRLRVSPHVNNSSPHVNNSLRIRSQFAKQGAVRLCSRTESSLETRSRLIQCSHEYMELNVGHGCLWAFARSRCRCHFVLLPAHASIYVSVQSFNLYLLNICLHRHHVDRECLCI